MDKDLRESIAYTRAVKTDLDLAPTSKNMKKDLRWRSRQEPSKKLNHPKVMSIRQPEHNTFVDEFVK